MNYIDTRSGDYPLSERDIRARHPEVSFPVLFEPPAGYAPVEPAEAPPHDALTHRAVEEPPQYEGGRWRQRWRIEPLAPAEAQAAFGALVQQYQMAVQRRLDAWAATRGYSGILSACTYATSRVPRFAAEGQRAVDLRDQTWATCWQVLEAVQCGRRPLPALEELLAELPALTWE